jgi:hypothetical protein
MTGGTEEGPCVTPMDLAEYKKQLDQDCPRVALDPENAEAYELVWYCLHDNLKELGPRLCDALTAGWPADQKAALIRRVGNAIRDKRVNDELYPKRKGTEA